MEALPLSPNPENLSPEDKEGLRRDREKAAILQHRTTACYLYAALSKSLGGGFAIWSCQLYLDKLLEEAGSPNDPVERMLVEQLALAHHNLGRLYLQAAQAATTEEAEVFNTAAARLLAEFRRLALALREYRAPMTPKEVTMIGQQNVAKGLQQIANLEQGATGTSEKKRHNNRLKNNPLKEIAHEHQHDLIPEPASGCSRKAELVETRPLDARCARAAAPPRNGKSAVAAFHGTEDR